MKGQRKLEWVKGATIGIIFILAFFLIENQYVRINIQFTGSTQISELQKSLQICNENLLAKCEPCPEVRCIGDLTIPVLLIGLFFGFLIGAVFTLHFGKEVEKRLKQIKKDEK